VQLRGALLIRGLRHQFECTAAVEALDANGVVLEACAELDLGALEMSRGLLRMIPARVRASIRVVLEREPA
jgi:hypothetical protein